MCMEQNRNTSTNIYKQKKSWNSLYPNDLPMEQLLLDEHRFHGFTFLTRHEFFFSERDGATFPRLVNSLK